MDQLKDQLQQLQPLLIEKLRELTSDSASDSASDSTPAPIPTFDSKTYTLELIREELLARGEDPSNVSRHIEKLSQNWRPIKGSGPWRISEQLPETAQQLVPGLIYMVPRDMDGPSIANRFFPQLEEEILGRLSASPSMGLRLRYYGVILPDLYLLVWDTSEERYGCTSEALLVQNIPGSKPVITRKLGTTAHDFDSSMRYLIQQAAGQLHRAQENVKFLESVVPVVEGFLIEADKHTVKDS